MGELVRDTERIVAQEHSGGKGCRVLGPAGEENNAKDDWSSHKPDTQWENWNYPQGIQECYTIRGELEAVSEAWRRERLHIRWQRI